MSTICSDIVNGFVSGNGYGWGNTANVVNNTISDTRGHVQQGKASLGAVDRAAGTASTMTSNINQNSFSEPKSDVPIHEPDGASVFQDAKTLRSYNRNEEDGISSSRIRTTISGLTKEGIGNVFQGQGLVDSQTKRATSEGFFDKDPDLVRGNDIPDPGPIPKDAPSTLGNKK